MKEIKRSNVPCWGNEQNPFHVNEMDDTISQVNSIDTSIAEVNSLPWTWKPDPSLTPTELIDSWKNFQTTLNGAVEKQKKEQAAKKTERLKERKVLGMNKSSVEYANKLKRFLKYKEYDKDTLKLLGVIATRSSEKHTKLDSEIKNAIVELECRLNDSTWLVNQARMIGKGIH
ncbi:hypothetical protein CJ260_00700 [Megasphaera sp. ASD88]|uniref:hypothetical protein n=1 Tax=Megasphaera sp. ASD88 TaxID=2027407 RepID=UPI000BAB2743|nr:hypothetical protein [Megasphaera sp. ASD88]PAV39990.1 hypothetical protein CJ260_00700 [Megasphaera sp. ASD88]